MLSYYFSECDEVQVKTTLADKMSMFKYEENSVAVCIVFLYSK